MIERQIFRHCLIIERQFAIVIQWKWFLFLIHRVIKGVGLNPLPKNIILAPGGR
jgi:hypothetical protein